MKTYKTNSFENRIIFLDKEEQENPLIIFEAFYQSDWLPGQLKTLKKWRNAVTYENEKYRQFIPSNLLYDCDLILRLLEAAWLLKGKKIGKLRIPEESSDDLVRWIMKRESKRLEHYPKSLSSNHIIKPHKVISKTFFKRDLDSYKRILKTWLSDALHPSFMEENLSKADVIGVYESLVGLIEAAWLINQRCQNKSNSD
ncbi:hypothetical protein [Pedobacter sp. Leaf250]|uniref:hypothetical protein n=1 Tax=Pedobacter sp. Leaf250 TaxID=2876559 RepID=UPI001E3C0CE1|nr:hypothetical protein [Pedobacter sp. Leaf250]